MIILSTTGSSPLVIPGDGVLRIRGVLPWEQHLAARSRIDYFKMEFAGEFYGRELRTEYVPDCPEDVANAVCADTQTLLSLQLPNGQPVWVSAGETLGPVETSALERAHGFNSAIVLFDRKLYLANSPAQVARALIVAGYKSENSRNSLSSRCFLPLLTVFNRIFPMELWEREQRVSGESGQPSWP